jgi:tRNA(fMet)-specific endonuclease VapC
MTYLLDADWTISFLNGRAAAVELLSRLADEGFALSVITWGEIYEGLLGGPDPERHIAQFDAFTAAGLELISPDLAIAREYARLRFELRSRGRMIPDNDIWIAATALSHGLTLLGRDRHFERIPALVLYRPG